MWPVPFGLGRNARGRDYVKMVVGGRAQYCDDLRAVTSWKVSAIKRIMGKDELA